MKDDYKIKLETGKLEVMIEKTLIEALDAMEKYSKFTPAEIVNTALKRFVSQHKDFLPPEARG